MRLVHGALAHLLLLFVSSTSAFISHGSITVRKDIDGCDWDIAYSGIQIFCHTTERPAFTLGIGDFVAVDHLGNFDINDTIIQKVELSEVDFSLPSVEFFNSEAGVGLMLDFEEDTENGVFVLKFTFPEKWHPEVERYNRVWAHLVGEAGEHIYGGGEQYTYLDLKGRNYPIWVREQGVGRNKSSEVTQIMDLLYGGGGDYHTSYWPQPSYLSSRKYYIESTFQSYHELDFTVEDRNTIYWHHTVPKLGVEGAVCYTCTLNILIKPTLMEIVQALNPGQPELPDWVYNGAILGVQGGTDTMLMRLEDARAHGIEVAGMWIQDWSGKIVTDFGTRVFWNWRWNETWYPNLDTVIRDLDAEGVKVTAYVTAHLNVEGDVYAEAAAEDHWLKFENGSQLQQDYGHFTVATVDITEVPQDCNCINTARIWYKDLIKQNLIDFGFAGWMADFGEYTPMGATSKYADRWWGMESGEVLHQSFSQAWASLNREAVEEAGKLGEVMYWMRSGGLKSKQHQVMAWAGDQTVDWTKSDGLPSSIVSALSLATSGMGLTHSDIGGYTGSGLFGLVRTKELLLRWAEYSVFSPIMRTHEGNEPESFHQFYSDEDTMLQFGRLTQIFTSLKNYTKTAVKQNAVEHIPVMRPLFLVFDNDTESYSQEYEYMFGDDLLVAPVLEPDLTAWTVYLPGPETWVHLWGEDELTGPITVEVEAPLGKPPVFYRRDSPWTELFVRIKDQFS